MDLDAMAPSGTVWIPVSPGELCDRLTILELKVERIAEGARRDAAVALLRVYEAVWSHAALPARGTLPEDRALRRVNAALWAIEDDLRLRERRVDFGAEFVDAARSVYRLNDERARLKAALDASLGAGGTEPKEHAG